jgi:hypothetical protein
MFGVADLKEIILSAITTYPPNYLYRCEVPKANFDALQHDGGDVDFVGINRCIPTEATCIEFKNVKVEIDNEGNEKVTKLLKLEKLTKQGNERRGEGFFKTYVAAISSIYSANCEIYNNYLPGMNSQEAKRIYNIQNDYSLDEKVGILIVEIVQPTNKNINDTCCFGVCVARPAKPQEQNEKITSDIKRIFKITEGNCE